MFNLEPKDQKKRASGFGGLIDRIMKKREQSGIDKNRRDSAVSRKDSVSSNASSTSKRKGSSSGPLNVQN